MNLRANRNMLPLFLGVWTFILFVSIPSILDLIEPARSIGQIVVDTTKEIVGDLTGEPAVEPDLSKREVWANILLFLSYTFFLATIMISIESIFNSKGRWYGLGGALLATIGLSVYLSHLATGTLFVVILILVVIVVLFLLDMT